MSYKVPILLYHDLESDDYTSEKSDPASKGTVVNINAIREQIRYLAENNFETISVSDLLGYTGPDKILLTRKIILTFDDGHFSNYYLAYPLLLEYGFKATFFIIADRINKKHYLSDEQIKEMSDNGMEIGSHGLTHKYFPLMNAEEMSFELSESKRILEPIINKSVNCFAFPGGHYNGDALRTLRASGYSGACSCLPGLNSGRTNRYLLKRIEIRGSVSIDDFRHVFSPGTVAFYKVVDLMKGLMRRSLGLRTYSRLRSKLYKFYIFKR